MAAREAEDAGDTADAARGFIVRLIGARIAWIAGTALLVGITIVGSMPYGGGSVVPLYLATRELAQQDFKGDVYSQIDTSDDPEIALVRNFVTKTEWDAQWYVPNADETSRYPLVEIAAVVDGVAGFYRHTDASERSEFKTNREFVKTARSAYAVRIEDISTPADREHWIAGTRWSVIDLKTQEVLGEFTAYAIDTLQGQTVFPGPFGNAGEPWAPWLRAGHVQYRSHRVQNACPEKDVHQQRLNGREFVRSVLVPVKQDIRIIPVR